MRGRWLLAAALVSIATVSGAQTGGDLDAAIRVRTRTIESAQSTRDEQLDAQAARGVLFRKTGRFDLAIVDLTEVLRSRPEADDVLVERGMALKATRQTDAAMVDFEEALRINPDNTDGLRQRAAEYRGRGRFADAVRDLNRAIADDPRDPWAVSERGLDQLDPARTVQRLAQSPVCQEGRRV